MRFCYIFGFIKLRRSRIKASILTAGIFFSQQSEVESQITGTVRTGITATGERLGGGGGNAEFGTVISAADCIYPEKQWLETAVTQKEV